jgi:hypothetical protein
VSPIWSEPTLQILCVNQLPPTTGYTKLAMTLASNTLRLAVSNSLDSIFIWSIPLGGKRAYSDGTCPATLDSTLTGEAGSGFGAALAMAETGRALVVGVAGSAKAPDGTAVLVVDITAPKAAAAPSPSPSTSLVYSPRASTTAALDSTYYQANPSTVIVSARYGSVGVPAPQTFSLGSWAAGSPGGAPWSASSGYSISPVNPYQSGGTPVAKSIVSLTSALNGLGLTTATLRTLVASLKPSSSPVTSG